MLGKRIADERQRLGMSLLEFAKRVGVHRNTQARYESGERSPSSDYLDSLYVLGVDVPYVLTGRHKSVDDELEFEYAEIGRAFSQLLGLSNQDLLLACSVVHQKMEGRRPDEYNFEGTFPRYQALIRNEYLSAADELLSKSKLFILEKHLMVEMLEKFEFFLDTKKLTLSPYKKAQAILDLYHAMQAVGGKRVELKMIEAAVDRAL